MRFSLMLLAATVNGLAALTAGAASAASVEVKDAVARVTVIPENRTDVKVEFIATNPKLPLKLRTFGGRTIVDGDLDRKIRNCRGSGERASVDVRDVGSIAYAEMPQVVIHTPRDVRIETGGAVFGDLEP